MKKLIFAIIVIIVLAVVLNLPIWIQWIRAKKEFINEGSNKYVVIEFNYNTVIWKCEYIYRPLIDAHIKIFGYTIAAEAAACEDSTIIFGKKIDG